MCGELVVHLRRRTGNFEWIGECRDLVGPCREHVRTVEKCGHLGLKYCELMVYGGDGGEHPVLHCSGRAVN